MKKVSLLGALILVSIVTYFFLAKQDAAPAKVQSTSLSVPSSTRRLFLGARKQSPKPSSQVVDGCEELTDQLEKIDFNIPVKDWVEAIDPEAFEGCQDPELVKRITALKTNCFEVFDEKTCSQEAVFLRALLRTRGIDDGTDRELLADLIMREFANQNPNFDRLKKFSEKMMELDPDQPAFQKLWASSKIISTMIKGKSPMDQTESIIKRVDPDLFSSPDMQGVKMAMMTGLEPGNVEEYARGFLSQKSDPGMHEVLGWALWKQNRPAEAIAELEQAIAMNPKDPWLKEQLKKINGKDANQDSYQARISLGINLEDLYN